MPAKEPNPEGRSSTGVRTRFPALYAELREIAEAMIVRRSPRSLVPTELVNEAFLRMSAEEARRRTDGRSELAARRDVEFKACFGAACRDVLVDHHRRRSAKKRGGELQAESISSTIAVPGGPDLGLVAVDEAIAVLEDLDPVLAELVELRLFGGLTHKECADLLGLSPKATEKKWSFARAWLKERLT